MYLKLFSPGDNVLLLGEGNFSFAVALRKHNLPVRLTATCFEPDITFNMQQENIDFLESKDVPVYLDVDSRKLHQHPILTKQKYSKIIFNFPHVGGKMKIHLNRELLKDTFKSVKDIITDNGRMILTLCRGQGGTPADEPQRQWDDSWQAVEMAAHGNFILVSVFPFCQTQFPDYKCVGYRSQETEFSTEGALVHVFLKKCPFYENIDSTIGPSRLMLQEVNSNFGKVLMPVLYSELYMCQPLNNKNSPTSFFQNILLTELNNLTKNNINLTLLTDNDVPLFVSHQQGVVCKVNGDSDGYRLRSCPTQVLDQVLLIWEKLSSDSLIFFPGVYFHSISGNDFMNDPPVSSIFLLVGKNATTCSYRYISVLTKVFKLSNITCVLRPRSVFGSDKNETPLPRETVENFNADANTVFGKVSTEWAYVYTDNSETDKVVSHIYTLENKGSTLDACILYPDILAKVLLYTQSWRELWTDDSRVEYQSVGDIERPILKQVMLYPLSYRFDITIRITSKTFSENKFYEVIWLAVGQLVTDVELLNKYESPEGWTSHCYRITYKSLDKPLCRSKVIEIQTNILGKLLVKALGVTVA